MWMGELCLALVYKVFGWEIVFGSCLKCRRMGKCVWLLFIMYVDGELCLAVVHNVCGRGLCFALVYNVFGWGIVFRSYL